MGSTCLITPTSSYKMCKTLKSNKVDVEVDIQRKLYKPKANHDQYKQVQTRCLDRDVMVKFWDWWILEKDDFSVSETGGSEEKIGVLPITIEPMTFWLLVQML